MAVIGWKLDVVDRAALLNRFLPIWPDIIADHVTFGGKLASGQLPPSVAAQIVGRADDGVGLEALVVAIDGTTARADGSTYHITWSLDRAAGRRPVESNDLLAAADWKLVTPVSIHLTPACLD